MTCVILLLSLLSVCPSAIAPLLVCRLIALNKNSGVCSIGIGDTARRIIAKAILTITRMGIQEAADSLQLSAGQISGIEAAVYAVDSLFQWEETEAILLVDASNAFNSLDHLSALHNIYRLCLSLATAFITPTGHQPNYLLRVMCYTPVKVYTTQGLLDESKHVSKSSEIGCFVQSTFGWFCVCLQIIQKWKFCMIHFWMIMHLPKLDVLYDPILDESEVIQNWMFCTIHFWMILSVPANHPKVEVCIIHFGWFWACL